MERINAYIDNWKSRTRKNATFRLYQLVKEEGNIRDVIREVQELISTAAYTLSTTTTIVDGFDEKASSTTDHDTHTTPDDPKVFDNDEGRYEDLMTRVNQILGALVDLTKEVLELRSVLVVLSC